MISMDLPWAPAVELQAFDRVHRIGQTRPVYIQRLVIENTVEDRVLKLQQKKVGVGYHAYITTEANLLYRQGLQTIYSERGVHKQVDVSTAGCTCDTPYLTVCHTGLTMEDFGHLFGL